MDAALSKMGLVALKELRKRDLQELNPVKKRRSTSKVLRKVLGH